MKRGNRAANLPRLNAAAIRAIERRGLARHGLSDLYFNLMNMPLPGLLGVLALGLLVINFGFAWVYFAIGGLGGGIHGRFASAFFFSVQTLSTTGYGSIYPVSLAANLVASAEIVVGELNLALATGVLFARLSRPRPRVLFSRVLVVRRLRGELVIMFRVVNERRSMISQAQMTVVLTREEDDGDGGVMRRMIPLQLERETNPIFALSWLVIHRITPESPLWQMTDKKLAEQGSVLICTLAGTDEGLNAGITARHVYGTEDIRRDHRFVDIIDKGQDGTYSIDYRRFHETEELPGEG
jgi:inward rectifier potassium channel